MISLGCHIEIFPPHLNVLLLQLLLRVSLTGLVCTVLQQELVVGADLALLLHIAHLVACLHHAVDIVDIQHSLLTMHGGYPQLDQSQFEKPADEDC